MKEYSAKLFDKAAEGPLQMGKPEIAAGRAYYAMFYVAEAPLYEKDMQFSQHGQVIAAYGKELPRQRNLIPNFIAG